MPRKELDWTKTGTLAAMADWLMKNGDCICVLAIRPHDSVFAVDLKCKPEDAADLVTEYLPRLVGRVEQTRREKKQAARLELGPNKE
jgi:hypothetical protein